MNPLRLHVVAYVQDAHTGEILQAAMVPVDNTHSIPPQLWYAPLGKQLVLSNLRYSLNPMGHVGLLPPRSVYGDPRRHSCITFFCQSGVDE